MRQNHSGATFSALTCLNSNKSAVLKPALAEFEGVESGAERTAVQSFVLLTHSARSLSRSAFLLRQFPRGCSSRGGRWHSQKHTCGESCGVGPRLQKQRGFRVNVYSPTREAFSGTDPPRLCMDESNRRYSLESEHVPAETSLRMST